MKKLIIILSFFSIVLIILTFINYEIETLDTNISNLSKEILRLKYDYDFLESEWEVISSPENIEKLSKIYFDHVKGSLIDQENFFKLLKHHEEN